MKFKIGDKVKNKWNMVYEINGFTKENSEHFSGKLIKCPSEELTLVAVKIGETLNGMHERNFQLIESRGHPLTDFFKK